MKVVGIWRVISVLVVFGIAPMFVAAQGQKPSPKPGEKGYYDREADYERPFVEKAMAEAKAKKDAAMNAALAKPTPHVSGHVDLTGIWISVDEGLPVAISADGKERRVVFPAFEKGKPETPKLPPNQPVYKPEFQAKVNKYRDDPNHYDPTGYKCLPPGVPRMGVPNQIVETPGQVVLLYQQGLAGGIPDNTFRVIPTDGRPHRTGIDPSALGDSIGKWEGDSLVIDVNHLSDETWLSGNGTLHTEDARITERLTRKGNTLEYTATVDDPAVLAKPWTSTRVIRVLGDSKENAIENPVPCVDNDSKHLVGTEHF
jgi:hypothetical protein